MTKVNTPYFLARRLAADKGGKSNSVMVKVATLSVVIGLSVMILALGVIFGFKREIAGKLTGMMSHVQVLHFEQANTFESDPISADQPFLKAIRVIPGFARMNRYATKPGILRGEESIQGVLLKGVGEDFDWSFFEENLVEGTLPRVADSARNKDVLLSRKLARMMNLGVGDKIELMFVQQPPRRDQYKIAGLYETDMADIDELLILTDLRNVQRLNGWSGDQITGFEIMTTDFNDLDRFSDDIFVLLRGMSAEYPEILQLMVTNLHDSNPIIFDWLETHDLNALIIIVVMLLVAIFNMIAAMLIILLEKTSMIGVLKAIGMANASIQRIFIYRSSYIILKGMILGNLIGLALCYFQQYTGILKLSAEGYFLTHVPVYVHGGYIVLLNLCVFAVIVLMQILPTMIVSRIRPEKTIRFD